MLMGDKDVKVFASLVKLNCAYTFVWRLYSYSPMDGSMALSNGLVAGNSLSGTGWCLFVYNLAPETEESTLWQLFGPFGAVQNVKVM